MAQKNTKSTQLKLETHNLVKTIADEYGLNMLDVLETATEFFYKKTFFKGLNEDFLKLFANNEIWELEIKRRELMGIDIPDGDKP